VLNGVYSFLVRRAFSIHCLRSLVVDFGATGSVFSTLDSCEYDWWSCNELSSVDVHVGQVPRVWDESDSLSFLTEGVLLDGSEGFLFLYGE